MHQFYLHSSRRGRVAVRVALLITLLGSCTTGSARPASTVSTEFDDNGAAVDDVPDAFPVHKVWQHVTSDVDVVILEYSAALNDADTSRLERILCSGAGVDKARAARVAAERDELPTILIDTIQAQTPESATFEIREFPSRAEIAAVARVRASDAGPRRLCIDELTVVGASNASPQALGAIQVP